MSLESDLMKKDGFVKLPSLFGAKDIEALKQKAVDSDQYKAARAAYRPPLTRSLDDNGFEFRNDSDLAEDFLAEFMADRGHLIETLCGQPVLRTNNHLIEVSKKTGGLHWHVGYYSFSYTFPEDYGVTLWFPLTPVTEEKRGGMQYISRAAVDGFFLYPFSTWHFDMLADWEPGEGYLKATTSNAYMVNAACDLINTSVPAQHIQEDMFELGDGFLFDKYVIHRSAPLTEGSRMAVVCRFVGQDARLDLDRLQSMFNHLCKSAISTGGIKNSNTVDLNEKGEPVPTDPFFRFMVEKCQHGDPMQDVLARYDDE